MPDLDRWENEGGFVYQPAGNRRLKALQRKHTELDSRVEQELKRPSPCGIELKRLKQEKLYLKDQIRQLGA